MGVKESVGFNRLSFFQNQKIEKMQIKIMELNYKKEVEILLNYR